MRSSEVSNVFDGICVQYKEPPIDQYCTIHVFSFHRYCGTTEFADGMWAGVELEKPIGKNNGSVNGISYFTCQVFHWLHCYKRICIHLLI